MRLSFKVKLHKLSKEQEEILEDLFWHIRKVYNMLLYELRESIRNIDSNKNINLIATPIYKEYRENNWHSNYLHSHTLQEAILSVVQDYKGYIKAKEEYSKNQIKFKGEPRIPRYKKEGNNIIVYTKYGVRLKGNKLKLSLSKENKNKKNVKNTKIINR